MRIHLTSLMATMFWLQDVKNQVAASDTVFGHIDPYGPVFLNTPTTLNVTLTSLGKQTTKVNVFLCQGVALSSEFPGASGASQSYKITWMQDLCIAADGVSKCSKTGTEPVIHGGQSNAVQFTINTLTGAERRDEPVGTGSLSNYFFCVSLDGTNCHVYSQNTFSLGANGNAAPFAIPTTDVSLLNPTSTPPFTIGTISTVLASFPASITPSGGPPTTTSFAVTVSRSETGTTTTTQGLESASTRPTSAASSKPSGGLSVGAKAGIAVGALGVLFLILLAALFFLRRAHRKKRAHNSEQVMLNRSLANDSRDLMAEKEAEHTSPSSFDAPVPVFAGGMSAGERPGSGGRHSALSPYEQIPSQPYSGSAAAVPRRKATTSAPSNTQPRGLDSIPASEPLAAGGLVSRGVSNASTNIVSPRSPVAPSSSDPSNRSHEFEEYHDVPVYGDARHVPQVFNGGLQAPFLAEGSENSLSSAEAARLAEEEEERRIDAAIAEAERAKGGGR